MIEILIKLHTFFQLKLLLYLGQNFFVCLSVHFQ